MPCPEVVPCPHTRLFPITHLFNWLYRCNAWTCDITTRYDWNAVSREQNTPLTHNWTAVYIYTTILELPELPWWSFLHQYTAATDEVNVWFTSQKVFVCIHVKVKRFFLTVFILISITQVCVIGCLYCIWCLLLSLFMLLTCSCDLLSAYFHLWTP